MQITIAKNLHRPRFGLGFTWSRVILRDQGFRDYWKYINGLRLHLNRKVYFIELWSASYPRRGGIVRLYRRSSR